MTFQKYTFQDGAFCLHGITGIIANAKISAWYNAEGQLLASEYFRNNGDDIARNIPQQWRNVREALKRRGQLYKSMRQPILPRGRRYYSIQLENCGYDCPQWVVRFMDEWIGCRARLEDAEALALDYDNKRLEAIS